MDRKPDQQSAGRSGRAGRSRRGSPAARRSARRSARGRWTWLWIPALVLVAVGAVWTWNSLRGSGPAGEPVTLGQPAMDLEAGDRAVALVFPNWDATGFVTEQRRVASRDRLEEDLITVMLALCDGPREGGCIGALPAGTRPLGAFYDEAKGSVVLDFSRELVVNHPGGSAAESATLTSILRTLALNFPEIHTCYLLVDGGQSLTLAGHLTLDRPFAPRRWL